MPRDASLRQRGDRRYSFADHGNTELGQRQGKYIIKNNLADHWSPTYGDGVTTIRIFPQRTVEDPTGQAWDPYRFSTEANHFGDWIRRYPAVRNMGDPGVSYIMADPADPTVEDPQMLPAWVLFNAIDRAVANQQEQQGWAGLLRGGRGRGAQLCRPSEVYLVQCAIMQHKQQVYSPPKGFQPDDKGIVMELSASAGIAMLAELNKLNEGVQAAPDDWNSICTCGDPINLDTGGFVTFYKLADGDPRQRQAAAATGWNAPQQPGGGQGGGGQNEPIGYGCYVEPTFNGMPGALRAYEAWIAAKVKPWDEILHFPSVEEQAHLLADKFPPNVILYAFRDNPDWIPETIRNRAVARTQVDMGAAQAQPGQPGQPGFGAPPQGPPPGAPPAGAAPVQPQSGFGAPPQAGFPIEQPAAGVPAAGFGAPPQGAPPVETPMPVQGQFAGPPPGAAVMPGQPAQPAQPVQPVQPVQPAAQAPPAAAPQPGGFAAPPQAAPVAGQPGAFVDPAQAAGQMGWGAEGNSAAPTQPAAAPPAQPAQPAGFGAPPQAAPLQPQAQPVQPVQPQAQPVQPVGGFGVPPQGAAPGQPMQPAQTVQPQQQFEQPPAQPADPAQMSRSQLALEAARTAAGRT